MKYAVNQKENMMFTGFTSNIKLELSAFKLFLGADYDLISCHLSLHSIT